MRRLLRPMAALALTLLGAAASALSPPVPPFKPPPTWQPPAIVVPTPGQQAIQLRSARIRTTLAGGQAQTDVELVLFNPNGRQLEGELQFPLLQGQVVTAFALDVNGRLRDAVAVPKARGQEIFEDIRRRRVDPGLLEATAGNQYKLRVYPLPPHGERRVALTVTETLVRQLGTAMLRLPLEFGAPVGTLDVAVTAPGARPGELRLVGGPPGVEAAPASQDGATLRLVRRHWEAPRGAAGWLQVGLREPDRPQLMLGSTGATRYFSGHVPLRDELVRRPDPKHVALVWDASGSGAQQARVLAVLDSWFAALHQPVQVSLVVVRNRAEPVRRFTVAPGRFAVLAEALRQEPFDGASNFDDLPVPAGVDLTLLVSDGLATDGQRRIGYRAAAPLFAINGATAADVPRLTRLAERTGGAYVDAAALAPAEAARAMLMHGWRIERLHSVVAEDLVAPSRAVREGRIALAGRVIDTGGVVEIALAHPDGRRRTLRARLPATETGRRWPGQQWAQWRTDELADHAPAHAAELRRIAAEHGIAGPNTSLIVLELASDYAQYDLPPPLELAGEVARLRQLRQGQERATQQAHLEQMVRQFEARQRWWERDFSKEAPPQEVHGPVSAQAALGERRESAAPKPSPMPAPAPAARVQAAPAPAFAPQAAGRSLADAAAPAAPQQQPRIALQALAPDSPAMRRLADAPDAELYAAYLDERRENAASSAFFLDAAGVFLQRGQRELGLRVLSNLAELNLENRQLLRLYAYRLVQARQHALAVPVFERVAALAPNEPQSWRDLALAQAEAGLPQRAVDHLWQVVARPWHVRFAGVNMIALAELNALAAQARADGLPLDLSRVDPRLQRNLPLALRVVLAWDTDDTDMDLWVTDPNGEVASYARRLTHQGGAMSPDATGGYGPEEFALKQAKAGKYLVQAQFYGHNQQVLSAGTTVMVRVTTGFGTPASRDEWITVRLTRGRETVRLGEIEMQ
jgi:Ca-activated chloride channel family protein